MDPPERKSMSPLDLRRLIASLGITQTGAAKLVGLHSRTIRRWLAGESEIPVPVSRLLALTTLRSPWHQNVARL